MYQCMLRKKLLPSKNHQCVANRFAPPNLLSPPRRFEIEPAKRKKRHAQHTYPVIQFAAKRCLNWITAESMEVGKNGKGFTFFNPGLSGTARFSEVVFFYIPHSYSPCHCGINDALGGCQHSVSCSMILRILFASRIFCAESLVYVIHPKHVLGKGFVSGWSFQLVECFK